MRFSRDLARIWSESCEAYIMRVIYRDGYIVDENGRVVIPRG